MKLGKKPARQDARNLKLRAVLQSAFVPILPDAFDFDDRYGAPLPTPMYANDKFGCCVIAGRAHQTRRLELADQGGLITISDDEVTSEYFSESHGQDGGLVVLLSLRSWRANGWKVGLTNYKIMAFVELEVHDHEAVKSAIYGMTGVGVGLSLPRTAQTQFEKHKVWTLESSGPDATWNSWGGHYVYCPAYSATGPICITWGRRQQMTWDFFDTYADEVYSVVDAKTPPYHIIDKQKVGNFLATL